MIKKGLIFIIYLLLNTSFIQASSTPSLLDTHGNPSSYLRTLFKTLNFPYEGNVAELNTIAQENFLRKKGEERWHMKEVYADKRTEILSLLEKMNFLNRISPSSSDYDYIIIHGATITRMRDRVKFFIDLWKELPLSTQEKVKIVFLVGDRILDPKIETKKDLLDPNGALTFFRKGWKEPLHLPKTESEAARIIWDQMIEDPDLRNRVFFVEAKTLKGGRRPTTYDTLEAWLYSSKVDANHLQSSKILAISNNPYILQQHQVFRNFLDKTGFQNTSLETVGFESDVSTPIAVYLDNIARCLYESQKKLN